MDPVVTTIGATLKVIQVIIKLVSDIGEISAKARKHKTVVANFANFIAETGKRLERQESSLNQRPPGETLTLPGETLNKLGKLKDLLEDSKTLLKELESPVCLPMIKKVHERIRTLQDQIQSVRLDIIDDIVHRMQPPAEECAHLSFQFHYGNQVQLKLQPKFFQGPSYWRSMRIHIGGNSNLWATSVRIPYRISWRKK